VEEFGAEEVEPEEEDAIEESARAWEVELTRAEEVMVEMHAASRSRAATEERDRYREEP
jgi:hypothetical protein